MLCRCTGDMHTIRCDRFSVVVIKPDEEIDCVDQLNNKDLWKTDNACDPSLYIEQRYVL